MHRALLSILLCVVPTGLAFAQVKVANPGFEQASADGVPSGWFVPPVVAEAGFKAKVVDEGCRTGRCAMITRVANPPENIFGNLMQSLPAAGYTLHRVRLRAAIRVAQPSGGPPDTRSQMWLRLDRADNSMAFLENMDRRPIRSSEWNTYDIETDVPEDVSRFAFGFMLFGAGSVWVDDVSLEILDNIEIRKDKIEPPRPLTTQGLVNLTAFTRTYGYVRFFHPSDQAARTDWETFAVEGIRKVEDAGSNTELIQRLQQILAPIAPTVRIFATGQRPPAPDVPAAPEITRYKHNGVGLPTAMSAYNIYTSQRQKVPAAGQEVPKPFEAEIVPGITASVPLALYVDAGGTLPHAPLPDTGVVYDRTAADRATRLAAVVIAWNVFQHFYPYFDVVKTDWPSELAKALRSAATDTGVDDFHLTLRRLVAALKDGHGNVNSPHMRPAQQPPLTLDWIEGQFIVTRVQPGKSEGIAPGDRVLKIDGKPVADAAAEARALISGATDQWIQYRSVGELSRCDPDTHRMTLEIEPFASPGTSKSVELACVPPRFKDMETYTEPRPLKITELEPGIIYGDLDRVKEADWQEVIPRLEKAKGIIFDMRGYPDQPGIQALAHLTDTVIRSAKWNVSSAALPDRLDSPFHESGWDVKPEKPYFTARRVFLTDGRAISYAETVMGIVEHYKLGEIVGGPTAGTNGNVNPFKLPGGYTIAWTGMKVLKHDGSQHHGIGILPTVPVSRTRKGVAEGKDEILMRGLAVVKEAKQ
jgi:C-terminal processing protease CtpA/Prc